MIKAKRIVNMSINGTVISIDNQKGGFKNEQTGEVSKPTWKIVFMEDIGTDEQTKTQMTAIKVEDVETDEQAKELYKLVMKEVTISRVNFGKYKDKDNVYHDWYKTQLEFIKAK